MTYFRFSGAARLIAAFALPLILQGQSASTTIVSTAGYGPKVAPGSIAAVFGTNLATTNTAAAFDAKGHLPTSLSGSSVSVNGQPAQLIFVSPGQINFIIPENTSVGSAGVSIAS